MKISKLDVGVIISMVVSVSLVFVGYSVITGIFWGGGVTYFVAKYYYEKAGTDLRNESEKLRNRTDQIIRALDHEFESSVLVKDEEGEPIFSLIIRPETVVGKVEVFQPDVVSIIEPDPAKAKAEIFQPEVIEGKKPQEGNGEM